MKFLKVLEVTTRSGSYRYYTKEIYIKVSGILAFKTVKYREDDRDRKDLKTEILFDRTGDRGYYYSKLTVDELLKGEVDSKVKEVTRFDLIDFED
jgi:hypothetical protein